MFRQMYILFVIVFLLLCAGCSMTPPRPYAIPVSDLSHDYHYTRHDKKLIANAMQISKKRLGYRFGSSTPRLGGMDCSGAIHYLLERTAHIDSPRDASEQYVWVQRNGRMHYVHTDHFNSPEFNQLHPGDLLFWTGTYYTRHIPPITHVMLYIGKNKNGVPLMFGATEGIYGDQILQGVGVFDFTLPNPGDRARFVAYGCIPHYTCR